MRILFQADVLRLLPEADFRSASDAGLAGLHDLEVLAAAARDGRVLVTHDKHTMPGHFGEFLGEAVSAGVIVVPQSLPVARVLEDLALIWSASERGEWTNRIVYLPI
jgi:Domain of unknown function (DUF5615)